MKSDSGGEMESCRSSDSELEREIHEKEREIQTLQREVSSVYRNLAERDTELVRIRLECQRLLEENRHLKDQSARSESWGRIWRGEVGQCDQMARLFFHYLATYNNENLPDKIIF